MPSHPDQSGPFGDFVLETETNIQVDSSTLVGLGPRSLTPTLDLLLIIAPMAGDVATFASFIESLESTVEPPFSVLIVYDLEDNSALRMATEYAKTRPWLDLIPNTAGAGQANAWRAGFQAAGHGPAVVMSISGSDDPRDLARMRRLYAEGHRIIAGSRDMRGGRRRGETRFSRALGRLTNWLVRRLGRLSLTDPAHSFRLYDATLVNQLGIDSHWPEQIAVELAVKANTAGISIVEIPTTWTDPASWRGRMIRLLRLPGMLRQCRAADLSGEPPQRVTPQSPTPRP